MNDKENVTKALEEAVPFLESKGYGGIAHAVHDALELMENKPVLVKRRMLMHMWFWCCGSCGVALTEGDKFCRMCGRAVKWDEAD